MTLWGNCQRGQDRKVHKSLSEVIMLEAGEKVQGRIFWTGKTAFVIGTAKKTGDGSVLGNEVGIPGVGCGEKG